MKTIKLFTLLAALLCATTTFAQTNVSTDQELRNAITNGANITVTADINLSNSTLSIATGTTVTIDLGGHTLDRKLTQRGENGGQVITVREDATLNLSNGTLKGGWGGDSGGINNEGGTVNLTNVTITGCTGDDRGGGICNRSGGTLTMNGGSITNNISYDHTAPEGGGGIFNAEGATATLTNVAITGNEAKVKGGGGICNYGTMTIDGCTIQDNIANLNGGGVWNGNDATLSINGGNISGNTAEGQGGGIYTHSNFSMQGAINITGNKKNGINNNVYLTPGAIITVTGALAGSSIGITMENATGTFTSGYNDYNSGIDPATLFSADLPEVMAVTTDGNEAQLESILPEGSVYYIERSWDEVGKKIVTQTIILNEGEYTLLTAMDYDDDLSLSGGTYVIKTTGSNEVFVDGFLKLNGDTKLILCDDAMLKIEKVIRVAPQKSLSIYGQMKDNGRLQNNGFLSHTEFDYCGIGTYDGRGATYSFHGGNINVRCEGGRAAGIGLGTHHSDEEGYVQMPNINIYGGTIKAVGEGGWEKDEYCSSPGIGSFWEGADGVITIYGGDVDATGGHGGAGIGVGNQGNGDDDSRIVINGGHVVAHGGERAAGIGGGQNKQGRKVIINGGHVEAYGGDNGSGIGSGSVCNYNGKAELTINGGYVYAQGGSNGAGIGGGLESAGCKVLINGGEVHAFGGDDAAGIGGGWSNDGGNITITGGTVIARGAGNGAGIGSGSEKINFGYVNGGSLTITGGHVEAYGGDDAAGIGGGEDADGGTVTISGGYVYAKGSYHGAGIGGGEKGDGGNVTITGGTVHASAGDGGTGNRAIGPGYDSDEYGSLTIGDLMMVHAERMALAIERHDMCWYRTDVHVEPCTHQGATYTDSGSSVNVDCIYCSTGTMPYTFQANGNWNDETKWLGSIMPHDGNDVAVKADATIPNEYTAIVDSIAIDGGSLTIADGGQLMHNNEGVVATVQKEIASWTDVRDSYYLMALPFTSYTASNSPLVVNAPAKYDLYTFDGSQTHEEWRWHPDTLANGQGFLYADSIPAMVSRTLSLTGTLVPSSEALSFDLAHDDATPFGEWNLVGNPFACNATTNFDDFYVINGTGLVPASGTVAPLQGIFVKSTGNGQSVTFTAGQPSNAVQALNISLAKADRRDAGIVDLARVRFDEGEGLEKFMLNPSHTKIYIRQDGKDYAVVNIGTDVARNVSTEIPINFKATKDGTYTITVNPEGVEMGYLHLIDNLTGTDVDLLATNGRDAMHCVSTYTFEAKTTDYESRFKLVFSADGDVCEPSFAFVSNGEIIITGIADAGNASLQVIDVMGRVLVCRDAINRVSTSGMTPGVYVLRLINGNDVKTQKIIIK